MNEEKDFWIIDKSKAKDNDTLYLKDPQGRLEATLKRNGVVNLCIGGPLKDVISTEETDEKPSYLVTIHDIMTRMAVLELYGRRYFGKYWKPNTNIAIDEEKKGDVPKEGEMIPKAEFDNMKAVGTKLLKSLALQRNELALYVAILLYRLEVKSGGLIAGLPSVWITAFELKLHTGKQIKITLNPKTNDRYLEVIIPVIKPGTAGPGEPMEIPELPKPTKPEDKPS